MAASDWPESRFRVLVVDDDPDQTDSLLALLGLWGYEARGATSAVRALDVVRAWSPNVVLLDLVLPGMNGWKLGEILRARDESKEITLIALTGDSSQASRHRAFEFGFSYFLLKDLLGRPG